MEGGEAPAARCWAHSFTGKEAEISEELLLTQALHEEQGGPSAVTICWGPTGVAPLLGPSGVAPLLGPSGVAPSPPAGRVNVDTLTEAAVELG